MEFSGLYFLYVILPLMLLAYYLIPGLLGRNIVLAVSALAVYGLCQPMYLPLILILIRYTYNSGLKIKKGKKRSLVLPLAVILSVPLILKVLDPLLLSAGVASVSGGVVLGIVSRIATWMNKIGFNFSQPQGLAPLGIMFLTLASVSYLFDIYRGKYPAERSFWAFLQYMVFLPKLFQGPVVCYNELSSQFDDRRENFRHVFEGLVRFCTGLGKKVLLADYCARMIAELTEHRSDQALVGSWLAVVLFLFRVYYDFSGCFDMAVGLGKMFGFRLPESFHLPFTALSVTDFFSRWNLTVGTFFREYVEEPLRGKRPTAYNRYLALGISFCLMGLWYGGSLTFLLWGLFFAAVMIAEEMFQEELTDLPYWLRRLLTMLALVLGFTLFMHKDVQSLGNALKAMIGNGGFSVRGDGTRVMNCIPLLGCCLFGVTDLPRKVRLRWRKLCGLAGGKTVSRPVLTYVYIASFAAYVVLILWWCTVSRVGWEMVPSLFMSM